MALKTGLEEKPWYVSLIAGVVVGAIALAAVWYMPIRGGNEKIASLNKRADTLQGDIQNGRSAEQRLPQLREEARRLELELEKLRRILPSSRNTEELIKKFKSLVDQGDFVLEQLVFPPMSETTATSDDGAEEVYAEWPITVALQGRYHDLAVLFSRLSNFSRIINVEQFNITAIPIQTERTIRADFVAKTFVYREPSPPEEESQPGGRKKK